MEQLKGDTGQTTAEYALVLLAAAAIAFILISWASSDEAGLSEFFTSIIDNIKGQISA
ncbi:MAG: DUF4244 domain-containing protein [Actinobacteria bacterium]|nr:DUF4244 domain-containing protein [Actinomycetota bacterium]